MFFTTIFIAKQNCSFSFSTHSIHQLRLLLVAHGHDGEHQVDQVEGAEEDHDGEEDDVDGAAGCHDHVVHVLPVVKGDQLEGGQHGPQQVVKTCEPEVWILPDTAETDEPVRTRSEFKIVIII